MKPDATADTYEEFEIRSEPIELPPIRKGRPEYDEWPLVEKALELKEIGQISFYSAAKLVVAEAASPTTEERSTLMRIIRKMKVLAARKSNR